MPHDLAKLFATLKECPLPELGKQIDDLTLYEEVLAGIVSRQLAGEQVGPDEYPSRPGGKLTAMVWDLAWGARELSADEQEFMDYLDLLEEVYQASLEASEAGITPIAPASPPFDYTADQIKYISNPANYCSSEAADLSRAITNLGASGDSRAVKPIIGLLGISLPCAGLGPEGEWDVSWSVCEALKQLGELAIDPLVDVLLTETGDRQEAAASILRASPAVKQNDHVVDRLAPAIKISNAFIRASVAWIFSKVGTPRAASAAIELLGDSEAEVRYEAARAVGNGKFKR